MKIFIFFTVATIWIVICGIWLENTLPDYSDPLGFGMGGMFWLGYLFKKIN